MLLHVITYGCVQSRRIYERQDFVLGKFKSTPSINHPMFSVRNQGDVEHRRSEVLRSSSESRPERFVIL
jgi:hypothetical protein